MPIGQATRRAHSYEDDEGLLRSGLKLRHMRLTAALEEHGQISAAAHVMNISQPAASRMIAEIEAILGVEICERLPRGVRLTPYGAALARRARASCSKCARSTAKSPT